MRACWNAAATLPARTVRVMDKSASLGPLLQAFDATFAATGAVVDARVKGY